MQFDCGGLRGLVSAFKTHQCQRMMRSNRFVICVALFILYESVLIMTMYIEMVLGGTYYTRSWIMRSLKEDCTRSDKQLTTPHEGGMQGS